MLFAHFRSKRNTAKYARYRVTITGYIRPLTICTTRDIIYDSLCPGLCKRKKINTALFLTACALASARAKNKHDIIFDSQIFASVKK